MPAILITCRQVPFTSLTTYPVSFPPPWRERLLLNPAALQLSAEAHDTTLTSDSTGFAPR
jgi:hypothetical protein